MVLQKDATLYVVMEIDLLEVVSQMTAILVIHKSLITLELLLGLLLEVCALFF